MYYKEFEGIRIAVNSKGAELKSMATHNREYIWPGDEKYWGKSSPVLFPFVGAMKDGNYIYNEKKYLMGRHGFARDKEFEMVEEGRDFIKFMLKSQDESLKIYPFEFEFYITYILYIDRIKIRYEVRNIGEGDMYFSLGAHPAFVLDGEIDEYRIRFSEKENLDLYKINGVCIDPISEKYLIENNIIDLNKKIFENDALVFNKFKSDSLFIEKKNGEKLLEVTLKGFPWLGIWAPVGAPFVCIEPWFGVADFDNHDGKLENKVGINRLENGKTFEVDFDIVVEK
jgi:galactose mutarotase-like enzyme